MWFTEKVSVMVSGAIMPNPEEEPRLFSSPGTEAGDLIVGTEESGLCGNYLGLIVYVCGSFYILPAMNSQILKSFVILWQLLL